MTDSNQSFAILSKLRERLNRTLIGQETIVEQALMGILAKGHILLEGVPGLGKTLLVRALAALFGGESRRIQFTPDLMPSDVTGHALFDLADKKFKIRKGPVFTNLLLADEINRAPAKTQAALLEVMQEGQVTIEGRPMIVAPPFMVFATQNPIEQEGTYALPEAELDRFMFKVLMDYPDIANENALVKAVSGLADTPWGLETETPLITTAQILALQEQTRKVSVDDTVVDYAVRIARITREGSGLQIGAGPRASIFLVAAGRAKALLDGRGFVIPQDIKDVSLPILRHRVGLSADKELEGSSVDKVLETLLRQVDAPRK